MKAAFEFWEKLVRQASEGFLLRAVLPWGCVLLIKLGFGQFVMPDGRSVLVPFALLSDDHPALVSLALAAWIYLAALISDGFANRFISRYRGEAASGAYLPSDDQLPAEIRSWWDETDLPILSDDDRRRIISAKIERTLASALCEANSAAALYALTWFSASGIPSHFSDGMVGLFAIALLTLLTAGSSILAWRNLQSLIALDGIRRRLGDASRQESTPIGSIRLGHWHRIPQAAIFALLFPLLLVEASLFLNRSTFVRTEKTEVTRNEKEDKEEKNVPEHLTIIAVNDIYRLDGVAGGERGGLARLRTLRTSIERDGRKVILLHAGDFLSPSLVSGIFKGKSMIDVMNRLDGDKDRFDENMFVVFGNHEFDDSKCRDGAAVLDDRVARSQFTWLNGNLDFSDCYMQSSIPELRNVRKNAVLTVGKVKVGLFGIGLTPDKMENITTTDYPKYEDEMDVAVRNIDDLRRQGANFIIAITHLSYENDQRLLDELGSRGLDLILGGHDHDCMTLKASGGFAYGFKADSDAKTAWQIDLELPSSGRPTMKSKLITLDQSTPPDPDVSRRSKQLTDWAEAAFCRRTRKSDNPRCLDDRIGRTQASIDLDETTNRSKETGFGDWLADLVRSKTQADIAIINSGALGLNENLAANSELRARQIAAIFRYDSVVTTQLVSAKQVCEALEHGFSTPGKGAWPHVSGIKVKITGKSTTGNIVNVDRPDCDNDDRKLKVAGFPFLLCGNDGYRSFSPTNEASEKCVDRLTQAGRENGLISTIAEEAIRSAGTAGINPRTDGRVALPAEQAVQPLACRGTRDALFQYR